MNKKVKRFILFMLSLISVVGYSQSTFETNVYIPMRTFHYDRTILHELHPTEGGNIGAIFILRKNNNKLYQDIQSGIIRNSYGDLSILLQYGIGINIKENYIGLNLGFMSGYEKLYEYRGSTLDRLSGILRNSGIMPAVSISIEPNIKIDLKYFILKPVIVIAPDFVNGGIALKL